MKYNKERDLFPLISLLFICVCGSIAAFLYSKGYYTMDYGKMLALIFTLSMGCVLSIWTLGAAKFEYRLEAQTEMFERCPL